MTIKLPNLNLPSTGGEINLSKIVAEYLVLYFYPKDDTPGCTLQGQDFTTYHHMLTELGALVYGISRDNIKSHDKFKKKFAFPFY
jgi:peroxiredoxin Q/BCP